MSEHSGNLALLWSAKHRLRRSGHPAAPGSPVCRMSEKLEDHDNLFSFLALVCSQRLRDDERYDMTASLGFDKP